MVLLHPTEELREVRPEGERERRRGNKQEYSGRGGVGERGERGERRKGGDTI